MIPIDSKSVALGWVAVATIAIAAVYAFGTYGSRLKIESNDDDIQKVQEAVRQNQESSSQAEKLMREHLLEHHRELFEK